MTTRQIAVYTVVIDLIYDHGGETPDDPKHISSYFSDMGTAAARGAIQQLVDMGKLYLVGDMLHQKRAENEAKTRENLSETRAKVGRLGGVSSGNSRRASSEIKDLPEAIALSKREAEKEKREIREEERDESLSSARDRFAEFWAIVPRRVAKDKALAAFTKALRKTDAETIIQGMVRYAESRKGQDAQYTAHPASWLNAGRWADEPDIQTGGGDGNSKGNQRIRSWLAGASVAPRVDSGPDPDTSQPLLARR